MIGLPYGEKNCDNMLSRFHLISERHGRTDGQTDKIAISVPRLSVLTRDKSSDVSAVVKLSVGFLHLGSNVLPLYLAKFAKLS